MFGFITPGGCPGLVNGGKRNQLCFQRISAKGVELLLQQSEQGIM
jgi:hypothetical protein